MQRIKYYGVLKKKERIMNLEWKAAELYEFVKQYNKSDELNIYIDIDDNTLMLRNMAMTNSPKH